MAGAHGGGGCFVNSDPLLEALRISGPAGAAVVLLGVMIRQWLQFIRTEVATIKAGVAELTASATRRQLTAVADTAAIKAQLDEHSRRIHVMEGNK